MPLSVIELTGMRKNKFIKMFKNIIFDWSGVVRDSIESHLWTVNKMFEGAGAREISMQELRENWEQPYMGFYNKYVPQWTLEEEQKAFREVIARKDCPKVQPFKGIFELIKKLKEKGFSMVVLSGDDPSTILPEIKNFDLADVFKEVIVDSHDKAEEIQDLIKRNNFNPKETVFIGDTNHEVEVGKQAGMKTIAVTWGFCTEERLKATKPDYLVHNIKELEKVLLK